MTSHRNTKLADAGGLPKFLTDTPEARAINIIIGAENTLMDAINLLEVLGIAADALDESGLGTQSMIAMDLLKRIQADLNAAQVMLGHQP